MIIAPLYKPTSAQQRFDALMELYERNYRLLRELLPENIETLPDYWVSHLPKHLDIHLWVLERAKYTTTLRLSYRFEDSPREEYEPDLTIRIYHDARTAEAMSAIVHGKPREKRYASNWEWRWTLNRFLYRWLRYARYQGHHFRPHLTATQVIDSLPPQTTQESQ